MSRLTDRVSYLQGLAEGMKLNTEKDANRLILDILDVMGEMAAELENLENAHAELGEYVDSIDEDLADLEADLYDDDDEYCSGDCDTCDSNCEPDEEENGELLYECPHCGKEVVIDADDVDFDEDMKCPSCGEELFPELPEGAEEEEDE